MNNIVKFKYFYINNFKLIKNNNDYLALYLNNNLFTNEINNNLFTNEINNNLFTNEINNNLFNNNKNNEEKKSLFLLQTPIILDIVILKTNNKKYLELNLDENIENHIKFLNLVTSVENKIKTEINDNIKTQININIQNNKSLKVILDYSTQIFDKFKNNIDTITSNQVILLLKLDIKYNYYSWIVYQILQI